MDSTGLWTIGSLIAVQVQTLTIAVNASGSYANTATISTAQQINPNEQ
jgi:hypothetical protein